MSESLVRKALISRKSISYALAINGIDGAIAKSNEIGCVVCISVFDSSGHQVAFARMDGAPFQSIEVAHAKAFSVAGNGMSTHDFWSAIKSEEQITTASSQLIGGNWLGGGLPILLDGELVGALSVSGKSNMGQDIIIASAAIQMIEREFARL